MNKLTPQQLLVRFLAAVLLIVMIWSTLSSSGENKRLKTAIKENLLQIKKLESQKIIIFESIKIDSIKIMEKDSIILELKTKEYSLTNTLKHLKNEKLKIKNDFLTRSISERVRIFSKLATETDSIR